MTKPKISRGRVSKTLLFAAAKNWDSATAAAILDAAPELISATDPQGRQALHMACAVKPGGANLGEPNGTKTAGTLLKAGAGLEIAVPMEEDEEDFRAA